MKLSHDYLQLPEEFYTEQTPVPVRKPEMLIYNDTLGKSLGLSPEMAEKPAVFAGNEIPAGARPLAQAYSGHQFGFYTRLGDGRAVLLGEVEKDGKLYDIQLKGAGRTPYSRGGDGRAAVGPMLREYLVSEAMHGLGIATTRSLAVVKTGETVMRQTPLSGAVLTRVAESHLRVGTFQYALETGGKEAVRTLADYAIRRHGVTAKEKPLLTLFTHVVKKQVKLIADWMAVSFIHGVMNTDNMTISGETIDYGPCAFMEQYDENTVFSSIDGGGRYAYKNQPSIGQWNLTRFAEALLGAEDDAPSRVPEYENILKQYPAWYEAAYFSRMAEKIGVSDPDETDRALIRNLLEVMKELELDYTNTFVNLTRGPSVQEEKYRRWVEAWRERLEQKGITEKEARARMRAVNPVVIPRNLVLEQALAAAEEEDYAPVYALLDLLADPYDYEREIDPVYIEPMTREERAIYRTFCGT